MSLPLEPVLAHLENHLDASIERWKELLRIPGIGTDPARRADTRRAAEWLVEQLRALGLRCRGARYAGQPIVVGHHPGPARPPDRGCCTTGTTTCSRPIRSSCGTARRSSRPWSKLRTARA